ncbi:endophilin-B1-like [Hydractinia symbiolongicarpus]|uniref:endophilin-B1-like n=1 Tax=Hydractinia symbiolongicarpus TaxID=13093 RepID=UPI00254B89A5|nr:endophilin-B1-like [Hydractinia symbiolongicarpus]
MATNDQAQDYKESFLKMASSAISASKTGWTRARQFTEERIGSAEKTEYDAQFENLCARAERTKQLTEKVLRQAEAMLQPNPGLRIEEFMYEKLDKKNPPRPTNSFVLGQTMQDAGREVGPGTAYGSSLVKVGSTLKKMGNSEKDYMQKSMSHYLHPLRSFLENEMKTITKEKRTLDVKRLDLDACKSKVKKAPTAERMRQAETDLRQAQSDFDRQQEITKLLLEGIATAHANHLSALQSLVEAMGMYHAQCQQYIADLQKELQQPTHPPTRPKPPTAPHITAPSAPPSHLASDVNPEKPAVTRKAVVLYDYDAVDQSELSLLADEVVTVYSVEGLDGDWMMAERGLQRGKVPLTYLELV